MDRRAISEVAGTMVLIGVVVVGMMIVNLVIISTPTNTRIPSLQASMTNRSTLVTIVHQGGDSIPAGQYQILVDGVDQTANFNNSGTSPWSLGETLSFNASSMPQSAIMIYNGTGRGGVVILQTRFPWGVYVPPIPGGSGGSGGGGLGSTITPTPTTTPPGPAWYNCNWAYRKNITIINTSVSGTQTDFPVLISLDPATSGLSGKAQGDGDDIFFTDSTGNKIPHEIENYTSGTLVAWVKVPQIQSTANTSIFMYYGNLGASSQQNPTGVWSNGFQSVWHLNQTTGGSEAIKDSSSTANDGTDQGGPTLGAAGKIGNAITLDGTNDYISTKIQYANPQTFTSSLWFKTTNSASRKMFGFETDQTGTASSNWDRHLYIGTGGNVVAGIYNASGDVCYVVRTGSTKNDGNWHHAVMTYGSSTMKLYVDGSYIGQNTSGLAEDVNSYWRMGAYKLAYWPYSTGDGYFQGTLDEVRLSNTVRSDQWIATEYNNQNSPATFYSVGSEEGSTCSGTPTPTPTPGSCVVAVDATSSGTTIQTQSITISHTTSGSDRLMLVGVSINNDNFETVSSITYNGVALTKVGSVYNSRSGGDDARVEIWRLIAPATGTHDVVITFSASLAQQAVAGVMTFTGVDQTTPLGPFASNENDPSPATVTVSSATNELVFGVLSSEYGAITTDPGQTERWNIHVGTSDTYGAGSTKAGASSVNLQWTLTSTPHWAAAGVSIKPCSTPPPAGWYSCSWGYRKNITIDHTKVAGPLTYFPVLVSLASDSDLSSRAQSDGDDILFTTSDGLTKIPHEIESYSSGTLVAWVKVPSINAVTDTTIMMYYGNNGASDQQDTANVWDSNYKGVWHLKESGSGSSGEFLDSTSNNNDGQGGSGGSSETPDMTTSGKIGNGQDFNDGQWINVPNSGSLQPTTAITLSGWIYLRSYGYGADTDAILRKGEENPNNYNLRIDSEYVTLEFDNYDGGDGNYIGTTTISTGSWYHIVGTWQSGSQRIVYLNGAQVITDSGYTGPISTDTRDLYMGGRPWEDMIDGRLDETRISNVVRSAPWIATEYNNTASPSTFYSVGSQVASGCSVTPTPTPSFPWYNCDWPYRKNLTIDHTKVAGPLTNFPVLVSLDPATSGLDGKAQTSGNDILFTDSGGNKLSHEIESYSSGTLVAWVKVPSVSSTTPDTTIMMYYGNSVVGSQQDPTGVWDANYMAVYHMNQDPSGTVVDSTGHANLGSDGTMGAANLVTAKIGKGINLTHFGSPHYDHLTSTNTVTMQSFTMEAWGDADNWYNYMDLVGVSTHALPETFRDFYSNPDADLYIDLHDGGTSDIRHLTDALSTRRHAVVRYDLSTQALRGFLDGSTTAYSYSGVNKPSITGRVDVGAWYDANGAYFDDVFRGTLDEVRISNIARSNEWIATEYANQNSPATFYSVGGQVSSPCSYTPPPAGWYSCDWPYRKSITIDHTKVSATQTNFPVLVSLASDSDLSARAQGDGDDIFFTDSDGTTKLSHEIESYSAGTLVTWVKVPSLSSTTDTTIMMYYGNTAVGSQQDKNGVWDSNFVVVQHMNGGSYTALDDSTGNHNDVTSQVGAPTYLQPGQIGSAVSFSGTDAVEIQDSASLDLTSQVTVCAWIRPPVTLTNWARIVAKSHTSDVWPNTMYGLLYDSWNSTDNMRGEIAVGGNQNSAFGTTVISLNTWTYACANYDHSAIRVYVNGNPDGTPTSLSSNIDTNDMPLSIARSGYDSNYFTGRIDEVRVSSIARPASWISTEYANQNSPATFYSVGSQVASGCSVTPIPTLPYAPWYDCSWQERKGITIDHTRVNGTQTDFPVLISLASDSGLQSHAQSDGDDIFFTLSDGTTKLSHEIESYSSGTLVAWVKVPYLSSTTDTVLYMYYGNPSAPNEQDKNGVWDSNYKGVWHHDHDFLDSTSNGNTGTNSGSTNTAAKIARAQDYDGSNDYVDVGSGASIDSVFSGGGTVSAWIYPRGWGGGSFGRIADKTSETGNENGWAFAIDGSGIKATNYALRLGRGTTGTNGGWNAPTNSITLNQWQYVTMVYNDNSISNDPVFYINGISVAVTETDPPDGSIESDNAQNLRIGNWAGGTDRAFDGLIDEVRLSSTARSAPLIATEYNNQNSPSTFSSVAGEESAPCTPPPTTPPTPTATPTPSPPWFNCYWPYRKNITINKTAVSATQTNFPVLINLTSDADLKNHARSDGYDILFTREDGQTELYYERENYTASTGALTAWVKVPQIQNSANTTIYMYYGFLSSPDKSKPQDVWDANYTAVWHLNEAVTDESSAGTHYDSTSNANNGLQRNNAKIAGKMAGAQNFDGTLDYIQVPGAASLNATSNLTLEAWVYLNPAGDQKIFYKYNPSPSQLSGYGLAVKDTHIYYEFYGVDKIRYSNETAGTIPSNAWTHLAITWGKGERVRAYINSVLVNISYNGNTDINRTGYDARIGVSSWDTSQFAVTGRIDEVRLSITNRSAQWIATEYNNQANPALFHYIGPEEAFFCGGTSGPSYVQSRSLHFEYVNQASIALPGSTTAGDLLVLSCVINQSNSVATVTDSKNGNAYNSVLTTNVGNWGKVITYNVPNSLGGSGPITATVSLQSPANKTFDLFFFEYSGVASTGPVDVSSSGTATSGTSMNTSFATTSKAPALIYGFGAGDFSCSANSPYTGRETANGRCAMDQTVFMTGPFNVTATESSSGAWALQMVAFKGA